MGRAQRYVCVIVLHRAWEAGASFAKWPQRSWIAGLSKFPLAGRTV